MAEPLLRRPGWTLRLVAGLATTLGAGAAGGALAANEPLSSLPDRGALLPSDQLPVLPAGASRLQSTTAGAILGYVRNYPAGIYCDGSHDDTAAIQAAINAGASFDLPPGVCVTSASLRLSTAASHGQVIRGAGATAGDGGGAQKTVLRPTSGVSAALILDGSGFGGYLQGAAIEALTLDMGSMPSGAKGFSQLQAYDIRYANVRVIGDSGKLSWSFGPGAYTTTLNDVQGALVYCLGNGVNNPTTITLVNPDINALNVEQCANVTTIGGAIQPMWTGTNQIEYLPAGTSPRGFGPNTSGIYVALGSYMLSAQYISTIGTDWEALNQPPSSCALSGWSYGTYNDGAHGCHPMVLAVRVDSSVKNVTLTNATFAGMYLYDLPGSNVIATGYQTGGGLGNYIDGPLTVNGPLTLNSGQALSGYSDDHRNQTLVVDSATGAAFFSGGISTNTGAYVSTGPVQAGELYINPPFTGRNFANIGQFGCFSGATPASSSCFMSSGAKFVGLQDPAGSVESFSIDASTGRISAGSGICPGAGTDSNPTLTGGTCIISGAGMPASSLGSDGWYYLRSDCTHATGSCIWHKESGAWTSLM